MAEPRLYRQGDVLLRAIDRIPILARPVARDAGRIVLEYGEVTGHAHAIASPEPDALLSIGENLRFLRLMHAADLVHEEHSTVHLPAGNYAVIRQRVWTDQDADAEEEQWRYAGD